MNEAKRKNILFAVVAVVIAVVFFFAGFGTGFGVGKGAADAPDAVAEATEMDGGMLLSSDDDTDKGVSLTSVKLAREAYDDYDIMPIAETAYTVTATVSGDGLTAEQKGVTWGAAAFKDPSSSWATGKNVSDYVTATPNGNQLTVQCLKAFGEQIVIKCSSTFNPNVSKDLNVDYKRTPVSFNLHYCNRSGVLPSTSDANLNISSLKIGGSYSSPLTLFLFGFNNHGIASNAVAYWDNVCFKVGSDDIIFDSSSGTIDPSYGVRLRFFLDQSVFNSATTDYDLSCGKSFSSGGYLTFSYNAPASYFYISQYKLLSSLGTNMQQYIGQSSRVASYNGNSTRVQNFITAINHKSLHCELTLMDERNSSTAFVCQFLFNLNFSS